MSTQAQESNHSNVDALHSVAEMIDGLHVKQELTRAKKAAAKFTDQAIRAGQEHPKTAAAVLVGTGMLLGSIVHRLVMPQPTATQLIAKKLQRGAVSAGRSLLSGLALARKRLA